MARGDELNFDSGSLTRTRKQLKFGRAFGQTNMDPARQGRKRTGRSAGGWDERSLW